MTHRDDAEDPAAELLLPGQEPVIAPGVHGYMVEEDGVLWIPLIRAKHEGNGDVGRFLDALPRDKIVRFPTVLNPTLAGMLARRGFRPGRIWSAEFDQHVDVWERLAVPTEGR